MDLEAQQEKLEEANKLNSILVSIEKQNSLLDEVYKNNQKPRPTNTITLEKPNIEINKKDTEDKQIDKSTNKDINLEIKEEIKSVEENEDERETNEENIKNLEFKPVEDEKSTKTSLKEAVKENRAESNLKAPDWFNVVKEQLKDLVNNSSDLEETKESIKEVENKKEQENLQTLPTEEKQERIEERIVEEKEVNNINYEQPIKSEINVSKNNNYITEKIIEKSDDNLQKIENIKEETNLENPAIREEDKEAVIAQEEKPQINITLKNNLKNKEVKEEIADSEEQASTRDLIPENTNGLEAEPQPTLVEDLPKDELPTNAKVESSNIEKEQEVPEIPSIEQPVQPEASYTSEEVSEPPLESNNSLESLVSEISKQLVQLTQNNDKNFSNIANIIIGINNTLRSMHNNLNNLGNNNVFVNGESNNTGGGRRSSDNFNESNLQRYRQQIRNSDMINDVATRVLRHSIPGVTL